MQSQLSSTLKSHLPDIPSVKIDFHPNRDPRTAYNSSKLALLIESRPIPHLVPQLLHMISVVPPDWRFLFLGSNRSVVSVARSTATQHLVASRKLDLAVVPPPWGEVETKKHHDGTVTVKAGLGLDKEGVYRMMTDMRFYDNVIPGVEWLLKFEADSIMCANSNDSLNDWLHYDWAGAARYVCCRQRPSSRYADAIWIERQTIALLVMAACLTDESRPSVKSSLSKSATMTPGPKMSGLVSA